MSLLFSKHCCKRGLEDRDHYGKGHTLVIRELVTILLGCTTEIGSALNGAVCVYAKRLPANDRTLTLTSNDIEDPPDLSTQAEPRINFDVNPVTIRKLDVKTRTYCWYCKLSREERYIFGCLATETGVLVISHQV